MAARSHPGRRPPPPPIHPLANKSTEPELAPPTAPPAHHPGTSRASQPTPLTPRPSQPPSHPARPYAPARPRPSLPSLSTRQARLPTSTAQHDPSPTPRPLELPRTPVHPPHPRHDPTRERDPGTWRAPHPSLASPSGAAPRARRHQVGTTHARRQLGHLKQSGTPPPIESGYPRARRRRIPFRLL